MKTYILKVERKNIGKEPCDLYNGEYGSSPEKIQELIDKGIIEEEVEVAPGLFQSREDFEANMAFDEMRDNKLQDEL